MPRKSAALPLFSEAPAQELFSLKTDRRSMREALPRIDGDEEVRAALLPYCRLRPGEVWVDNKSGHRVAAIDATNASAVREVLRGENPRLCIADPPYNVAVGARNSSALGQVSVDAHDYFTERWLDAVLPVLASNSSLYVWLGADMKNGFHPVPEFCLSMRQRPEWSARNWITVRNQRGYGTQKNWMWVRQELFYYVKGRPEFNVEAEYTDIPKILRGYYKEVGGKLTENGERGRSDTIRAGNVWVDIQQVFYRLHENVPGCYAQKPLKSIERIIRASSGSKEVVLDPFSHSGTTLLAAEVNDRRAICLDIDPVYAEITIRRLERYRSTGSLGWQCESPFPEVPSAS